MQGFIFGGTTGETSESLRRKRAIAEQMLQQSSQAPRNIGEGLSAIGNALAGRLIEKRTSREMEKRQNEAWGPIADALGGGAKPAGFMPGEWDWMSGGKQPQGIPPVETRPLGKPGSFDESGDIYSAIESVESGGDPRAYAFKKLTGMGYEPHIAAGLVGNLVQESGPNLDPTAVGDNGNSFGAGQWNGPRKDALMSFAQTAGLDANSLDTQLAFLDNEMKGPESAAFSAIQGAQTPEEAARIASEKFWRPGNPQVGNRERYAREVYSLGGQQPGPGVQPTAQALSQPQQPQQGGLSGMPPLPVLIQAMQSGDLSEPQQAIVGMLIKQQIEGGGMTEYQRAQIDLQRQRLQMEGKNAGRGEFGLAPVWGVDAEGNPSLIQLGRDGQPVQPQLPEGFQIARDPIRIDAGTKTILLDPQTRQVIGEVDKNVAEEAAQSAAGSAEGARIGSAPKAVTQADIMLGDIDAVMNDPQLGNALGWGSYVPFDVPGYNTQPRSRIEKLQGQAFLQAFESLKGGGAITEIEGKKAEQAIARLRTSQTEKEFREALGELHGIVIAARERALARLPEGLPESGAAPAQPAAPKVLRYNPATGELE